MHSVGDWPWRRSNHERVDGERKEMEEKKAEEEEEETTEQIESSRPIAPQRLIPLSATPPSVKDLLLVLLLTKWLPTGSNTTASKELANRKKTRLLFSYNSSSPSPFSSSSSSSFSSSSFLHTCVPSYFNILLPSIIPIVTPYLSPL